MEEFKTKQQLTPGELPLAENCLCTGGAGRELVLHLHITGFPEQAGNWHLHSKLM